MTTNKSAIPWFGFALVIIGAALLLTKLHVIDVKFSTIFWAVVSMFGLVAAARGFAANYRWKIFWGTLWFLYGLFFFLRTSDIADIRGHIFIPASFLIFGVAFFMMYSNDVREWFFLIPAVVLGGAGAIFILADLDYVSYWEVYDTVRMYWPIVLIVFGLGFIFRRKNSQPPHNVVS